MEQSVFPRLNPRVFSNDGTDLQFCTTCAFSQACLAEGMDKSALAELHVLVEHVGPLQEGEFVFRQGDPFDAIAAVRAGTVKTTTIDRSGREQVLGFHLPGEVVGLNAIDGNTYPCSAVALDTVMLCRFSFPKMSMLAGRLPGLQRQLFRLMSRDIGHASMLAGDSSADERVAAFLIGLSRRLEARGFSPRRFQLSMQRADIANHLRMTPETLSRIFRRLQGNGWIQVHGREVELLDRAPMDELAAPLLDH
ncbi:cyclic nucleotide-binding domain-containing protein [Lysobacter sp. FW306-1B-D06B]|uniref:helix-turn-helix domain-containing protein n=1 Tax=Lysobacter sp. FW306-1B-D06B TaxID=3140250 RepID=UPI0031408B91